jgi:hypothetical protein
MRPARCQRRVTRRPATTQYAAVCARSSPKKHRLYAERDLAILEQRGVDVELVDTVSGMFVHTGPRPRDLAQYGAGWHTFLDHLDVTLSGDNPSGWYEQYHEPFHRYRDKVASDVPQNC